MTASPTSARAQVAVCGTGGMGTALVGRLIDAGYPVTVWNRSLDRARPLADRGAALADSASEAAAGAQHVFLALRDDEAVTQTLEQIGTTEAAVFNTSTIAPATARDCGSRNERFVSLPILGAPAAVADGSATYLASGPDDLIDAAAEVLGSLTSSLVRLGPEAFTAAAFKVVLNQLLLSGIAALSETIAVAQAVGVDNAFLLDFLKGSPLVAPALGNRVADLVSGDHDAWFTVPLGAKDLDLFVALGSDNEVDAALARGVRDRYLEAAQAGWADADIAAIIELLRTPEN